MNVLMIGSHLKVSGGITRVVKNYIKAGIGNKVNFTYLPTYIGGNHLVKIIYFIIKFFELYININIYNKKYDVAHIHMSYKGSFHRKRLIINILNKKGYP